MLILPRFLPSIRHPRLLALPCPFRQVLALASIREEGGIQSQWDQTRLCDEAGGGRRGIFRL